MNIPFLPILLILPIAGALIILAIRGEDEQAKSNIRWSALWVSLVNFAVALALWLAHDPTAAGFQFISQWEVFDGYTIRLGVDGIAILLILLTAFLMPISILASWEAINTRVREYMVSFLFMETLMLGVFCSLDIFAFYVFFEAGLIPMFLIIGIWGGARRVYAAFKFFLYTLLGSVLMLLAIIYMVNQAGTADIAELMAYDFDAGAQIWLWLAFFASFAVKMPMWPVHTWLPDAHVEAPTAGSVILAGVMLKMGGYGFIRFSLPMFPDASHELAWLIIALSLVAIVYTSLVALAQEDMKKLIAYSSVAHMGFVTLGLFTFNQQGIEGATFQMLSHGIVSGALFLCVGVVYDRIHTRMIDRYGGLANRMPKYALVFMLFTMASVGLPGTSGFVGELLVLIGAYKAAAWIAFIAATGVILGAAYMLWLYRRVVFGDLVKEDLKDILDLNKREILIFAPLVILVLWMGVYPKTFLVSLHAPVENLMMQVERGAPDHAAMTEEHASLQGVKETRP